MVKIGTINGRIAYQVKDKNEYIKNVKLFSDEDRYCIIQSTNTIICNNMEVGYLRSDNSIEWYVNPCTYYKYKEVKKVVEEKAPITLPVGEEINEVDDILNSVWKKEVLE